jgi:hypothetical protein
MGGSLFLYEKRCGIIWESFMNFSKLNISKAIRVFNSYTKETKNETKY